MDYKEKLRLAKEALESGSYDKDTIEYIFPELKESEDKRNIKDLIDELKGSLRAANCQNDACGGGHEKRIALLEWGIAWLEKQENPELEEDFGEFVERLHSQFPEVSFAKLSRIAVRVKNWLERLKKSDNAKWKPSKLQIQCLSDAVDTYHRRGYPAAVLTSLLDDLKKKSIILDTF